MVRIKVLLYHGGATVYSLRETLAERIRCPYPDAYLGEALDTTSFEYDPKVFISNL